MMNNQPLPIKNAFTASNSFLNSLTAFALVFFGWLSVTTSVRAQTIITQLDNTSADQTWTVPDCVYEITVEAWGAGGGGGHSSNGGQATGGGGGGAYVRSVLQVTPGQVFDYGVGAGGLGTPGNNSGGNSWFLNTATLLSQGGRGVSDNTTPGGAGGQANSSIGAVRFSGGNGGNGTGNGFFDASGGGGGAARSTSNGGNGSSGAGGNSTAPGGAGGRGFSYFGSDGEDGRNYGGGGGGGKEGSFFGDLGDQNGGNGAQGLIQISYNTAVGPANPANIVATNTALCVGESTTLTLNGGSASGVSTVWFEGACGNIAFAEEWQSQRYANSQTTITPSSEGVLNVTSTSSRPRINMYALGSFDPNIYNNIAIRYQVVSGTAGSAEIRFTNGRRTTPNSDQRAAVALNSSPGWHIANLNMASAKYWTDSNITGWRYEWASSNGAKMEIDYILLSSHPVLDVNGTDGNTIAVTPTETTTYSALRMSESNCALRTQCRSINISYIGREWTGSMSDDWNTAVNWKPAIVPTDDCCVVIPDGINLSISGIGSVAKAGTLLIAAGATLEVTSSNSIIVTDAITNNGQLIIRNNGSLIQINDVDGNTGAGEFLMERTVADVTNLNYIYWSSPVKGFDIKKINPRLSFQWIPTISTNPGEYGNWESYSGTMAPGKGYIIRGLMVPDQPINFVGVPRNGTITVPISRGNNTGTGNGGGRTDFTAIDDNWNLIGNPYPSAISADKFILQNADVIADDTVPLIAGTVYLWDHKGEPTLGAADPFYADYAYNYQGSNYVSYNLSGPNPSKFGGTIAAGQAFFVLMEDSGALTRNIEFNNAMRGAGTLKNDQFLRQTQNRSVKTAPAIERHRIWLDIINTNKKATSLLLGYIEGATDGMDRLYDGIEMNSTGLKFYSLIDANLRLSIQGKALPFDMSDTIPLGYDLATAGSYTIAINALDGLFEDAEQAIYLEDTFTNMIHNLRASPFTFYSEKGVFDDRFVLRFSSETLGTITLDYDYGIKVYNTNEVLNVMSPKETIESLIIYDVLGREIANQNAINSMTYKLPLHQQPNGTLIVLITLANGKQVSKKIMF